jgi:hypothetical protein
VAGFLAAILLSGDFATGGIPPSEFALSSGVREQEKWSVLIGTIRCNKRRY